MNNNKLKLLHEILTPIARTKSSQVSVFSDFCKMSACALSMKTREEEYLEIARKYDSIELDSIGKALGVLINIMQDSPYEDILGSYYLEIASNGSKKDRGEFYTPSHIAELMARISIDPDTIRKKGKPIRISEPACGSGNMILSIAKVLSPDCVSLMRVTCQDISPLTCDMCYINTTLWGVPAKIIWGNTLSREQLKVWTNIHWHRVGEDKIELFRSLFSSSDIPPQKPKTPEGQMTFTW